MTDTTTPKPFAWIGHSSSTGESVLLYDAVTMPVACRLDGNDTTLAIGVEGIEPLLPVSALPTPDFDDADHLEFAAVLVASLSSPSNTVTTGLRSRAGVMRRAAAHNALVDDVARAMVEAGTNWADRGNWDGISDSSREQWRDIARQVVEKFDITPKAGS